ncbi:hypothetical protein TNCV_3016331 [Trichonephila clavipes]|nr:hypothetical protein TNCV_3016331 [Trichonephila clavipes]
MVYSKRLKTTIAAIQWYVQSSTLRVDSTARVSISCFAAGYQVTKTNMSRVSILARFALQLLPTTNHETQKDRVRIGVLTFIEIMERDWKNNTRRS